jgi:hypothetical protein
MIEVTGPSNSYILLDVETGRFDSKSPPFFCEAETLGQAIERYCEHFKSSARPYDGDISVAPFSDGISLFMIYDDPNSRFRDLLVRVTVARGSNHLHEHVTSTMALSDGDVVNMGVPGC